MGKKYQLKRQAAEVQAKRIAEAVLRQRCKEEAMSEKEKKELYDTVYNEQIKRLNGEK